MVKTVRAPSSWAHVTGAVGQSWQWTTSGLRAAPPPRHRRPPPPSTATDSSLWQQQACRSELFREAVAR